MVKIMPRASALLLMLCLALSHVHGSIAEVKTYVADLYNAKKNDGWTCYFRISNAEDQALKAGKACGETEASLYWQAAEYATEIGDHEAAASIKRAYSHGQLPFGPFGLAGGLALSALFMKYFIDTALEPNRLRKENARLSAEIDGMLEEAWERERAERLRIAREEAERRVRIPEEEAEHLVLEAQFLWVLMQQQLETRARALRAEQESLAFARARRPWVEGLKVCLDELIARNEQKFLPVNPQNSQGCEEEKESSGAEVSRCLICYDDYSLTGLITLHPAVADQGAHTMCASCLRTVINNDRFVCHICRHNPTIDDLEFVSRQLNPMMKHLIW